MPTKERANDAWTDYQTPWVEETDVPFTYRVESRSSDNFGHYTVDLTQRDGMGYCSCYHFQFVANPNFRRHGKFIPYAPKREGVSECAHISAAREYYHQHVTIPMLAKFKNGIPS